MIRPFDLLLAGLVVGGAVWTYSIKHEAEEAADRVAALRRSIVAEQERIMFLRADWGFLNAPERLERLVRRHGEDLRLAPLSAAQIVHPADLPPPRPDPQDELETAGEPGDDFTTGSIDPAPTFAAPNFAAPGSIDDILGN